MNDQKRNTSLQWLRALAVLSIVVPLVFYAVFSGLRYFEARDEAELRVSRSLRVAHEHAAKVVAGAEALQDRFFDLVDGKSLIDLRNDQQKLHLALVTRIKDQPQIQSVWIMGADGKALATSRFFPAPAIDYSDRQYFQFHRDGDKGRFLSQPMITRTTNERIVDLSVRFSGPDGKFGGVINVSLLTSYFEDFYSDLVADEPGLAVNLFREDGTIFTRWPLRPEGPARLAPNSPVMSRISKGEQSGQMRGVSSVDNQDRLIAFKKVGNYPLYVGTGMNLTTLRNDLLKQFGILFAIGILPFGALIFTAKVALRSATEALASAAQLEKETITRRRAEEALLQAQKLEALGRLTGGVAHDFNNALMVISNNLYLLKRLAANVGSKQIESMGRAVDSATKLTRQLLAFSRRQALVAEYVNLQDKLPSIKELISPVLGSQVRLRVEVEPSTRAILVDMAELELGLLNLGINARDAMPAGGTFAIMARNATAREAGISASEAVVIEASDTGTGIDPAVLNKVFDPFFTTKPVGEGTGLGLSQVYGLCQRAGGRVAITSVVGSGTKVSLFFPATSQEPKNVEKVSQNDTKGLGRNLLVVEDNNEVAASLIPLLEALDCVVTRVDSAAAACKWLSETDQMPDMVLTDVVMPGEMDGIGLAKFIRQTRPDLPVLLMTGYAEHLDTIAELGFEVLPKPCSADVLSAAISRVTRSQN